MGNFTKSLKIFGNIEAYNILRVHLCNHGQLTNVTYDFGNLDATVLIISATMGQFTNVTYNFGNMEADNVEHLCDHGAVHKRYL
jgi:hypothetical protein